MKKSILVTLIIFTVAIIMCFGYVIGHYSIDNYNISNIGYNTYSIQNNLKEGRPIMYLIDQIAFMLNMSYEMFFCITVILAILFTSITITIFYNITKQYFKIERLISKILYLIICYTIFFNFMYIENLYFVESIVMSLSLMLYLVSANYLVNKNYKVISILLSMLATLCYNGFLCYYVTIVPILSILKNKNSYKNILKDFIISVLFILISVAINLLQIKIVCEFYNLANNRIGSIFNIFYNIKVILYYLPAIITENSGLFPKYMYLLFVFISYIIALYITYKNKDYNFLLNLLLITIVSISSCFAIPLISLSSFTTGRLLYGIGMSIGVILLLLFYELNQKDSETRFKLKVILAIIILSYFILNFWNYIYLISMHRKVNETDEVEILNICNEIVEYEKNNHLIVEKITGIPLQTTDKNKNYYKFVNRYNTVTSKAITCYYSYHGAISLYGKKRLQTIQLSDNLVTECIERFKQEDLKYILIKDTIILPIYNW